MLGWMNYKLETVLLREVSTISDNQSDIPSTFYTKSSRFMPCHVPCAQLCPILCDPWTLSSVHGLFQARILEWFAISFSRGSSPSSDQTPVSCIAGRFFTHWVMGKTLLGYVDDTTLMAKSKEELKNLLIRVKDKSEKDSLKLNIKKLRSWDLAPFFHGK